MKLHTIKDTKRIFIITIKYLDYKEYIYIFYIMNVNMHVYVMH